MADRTTTGFAAAMLVAASTATPFAQTPDRGVELGGHVAVLRLSEFDVTGTGAGVGAAWRFARGVSIDGAFTWFPGRDSSGGSRVAQQQRSLGLIGVRSGIGLGPMEVFGGARVGLLRFSPVEGAVCIAVSVVPLPLDCQIATGYTAFAAEIGGGLAVVAARRLQVHVSAGDLIVRYGQEAYRRNGNLADGFTSHNLQVSSGLNWRF